ncbi:MAG: ATP-binding protein [Planctomycetota bacterium]|nr:ATP-binding protein [Planctomycetota bacterium]
MSDEMEFLSALDAFGKRSTLDRLLDRLPLGIYLDKTKDGCIYVNAAFAEMFGLTRKECLAFGWARVIHPDDMSTLQTEIRRYEQTQEPASVQYRVVHDDGQMRWIHARVEAIVGDDGTHLGSIGILLDVTRERNRQERLEEQQKLEVVGRLAGRIAHDFNNLLTVLLSNAEFLQAEPLTPRGQKLVDGISQTIDYAEKLTEQLLLVTRRRRVREEMAPLDAELERLRPLLSRTLGEGIEVHTELGAGDAQLPIDAGQLSQIVVNLALNGRDAMNGAGPLAIATRARDDRVELSVTDAGHGMSPQVARRVFEPFFTTKEPGRGTGLGLSTVRDIVESAGGDVQVDSTEGSGTTFVVRFPAWYGQLDEIELNAETMTALSGEARVLLLEDNDHIRTPMGYALAMHGYDVVPAASLKEAREKLDGTAPVDLVVADVLLHDGVGTTMVDEVKATHPDIAVVYISGFEGDHLPEERLADARTRFLRKPFRPRTLLETVRELLSAEPPPSA